MTFYYCTNISCFKLSCILGACIKLVYSVIKGTYVVIWFQLSTSVDYTTATVTMESDKFICVQENVGKSRKFHIVDLNNMTYSDRCTTAADSAIMNPASKVIAFKGWHILHILTLWDQLHSCISLLYLSCKKLMRMRCPCVYCVSLARQV